MTDNHNDPQSFEKFASCKLEYDLDESVGSAAFWVQFWNQFHPQPPTHTQKGIFIVQSALIQWIAYITQH